jgi:predicted hydrocarbon binding protein
VRGDVLITDLQYIERISGPKAEKAIKKKLKEIEAKIDFKKINNTGWYPISWKVLILILTREVMDWKDQDLIDMGRFASRQSFVLKTLLKYFVSLERTFQESVRFWLKYWDAGEMIPYKIDEKEKYLIIQLKNFKIHPDLCLYFTGHFESIANLILKSEKISVKETKCQFRGNDFHEFEIRWE